jgi:hypothetical protein
MVNQSQALNILSEIRAATFANAAPLPLRESAHPEWQGRGVGERCGPDLA